MLTPAEVKNITFKKAFSGYSFAEVDEFISEVSDSYEKLYAENAELLSKLDLLIDKVEKYRDEEDMLKCAIINAQKMGDSIIRNAQNKAELIVEEAKVKCEKIEEQYRISANIKRDEYNKLQKSIDEFKNHLLVTYKTHLEMIKELPSFEKKEKPEEEPLYFRDKEPAESEGEKPVRNENDDEAAAETVPEYDGEEGGREDLNTGGRPGFSDRENDREEAEFVMGDQDTMEFDMDIPPDEEEERVPVFEKQDKSPVKIIDDDIDEMPEREIFFGADYKIDEADGKRRGLFGRKR